MSAFLAASRALHADPNLSLAGTYTPASTGTALPVRVIRSSPVETLDGGPFAARAARREEASLPCAALPVDPVEGDMLAIGAEVFVVEGVQRDAECAAWVLRLGDA